MSDEFKDVSEHVGMVRTADSGGDKVVFDRVIDYLIVAQWF